MTDPDVRSLLEHAATLAPSQLDRPSPAGQARRRGAYRAAGSAGAVVLVVAMAFAIAPHVGQGPQRLAQGPSGGAATGSDTHGPEPAHASRYVGTWTAPDGKPAERGDSLDRTYEIASRRMPSHCEWDKAVVLQVPWPLGSTYVIGPDPVPVREYMRDPDHVLPDLPGAFRSELDLDARLPQGATPTGYTVGEVELWFGPDDGEQFAYLVRPEGVERWPREFESILCL